MNWSFNMKTKSFKEIMEFTRISSSEIAWKKAKMASDLRHLFFNQKNFEAGNAMGLIKKNSLLLAAKLNPEITVGIDSNYQIGMLSIRYGKKKLHLPLAYSAEFDALHQSKF